MANSREGRLDRIRRAYMNPVLCRKVVERKEHVLILGEALDRLWMLGGISRRELRVRQHPIGPRPS